MTPRLITPPAVLAVSMDAARRAARAPGNSLDAEITDKVQGIIEEVEHKTGRAFITQTWAVTLDRFDGAIKLPNAPLISVDHIKFYDVAGVLQMLDPQDYVVNTGSEPGSVSPAPGLMWPATQTQREGAVEVQYMCGFGATDVAVPAAIKRYILGMLENDYYPNPNAQYLCGLLDRYWVYL